MKNKKLLTAIAISIVLICLIPFLFFRLIQFISFLDEFSQLRFYPEQVPSREIVSADAFSLVWSTKTGNGSQYIFYTQIFSPDDKNLIYITPYTMNSIDFFTGQPLWTTEIHEDTRFHLYDDKIFSLNSYDKTVPFVSDEDLNISLRCKNKDKSTLRVYDPQTGGILWEYSYYNVSGHDVYFDGNSVIVRGLTISLNKYLSDFEIDIDSGQMLRVTCQSYSDYKRISNDEGILSSGYSPITRDWEWERNTELPAFITKGTKLIMVDRQTKQPVKEITFSGFSLNPDAMTLIIRNDVLVVYLDDSNQFFAFQVK